MAILTGTPNVMVTSASPSYTHDSLINIIYTTSNIKRSYDSSLHTGTGTQSINPHVRQMAWPDNVNHSSCEACSATNNGRCNATTANGRHTMDPYDHMEHNPCRTRHIMRQQNNTNTQTGQDSVPEKHTANVALGAQPTAQHGRHNTQPNKVTTQCMYK